MKNGHGALTRTNHEWGSKARKEDDGARGMRRRGRVDAINEALDEMDRDSQETAEHHAEINRIMSELRMEDELRKKMLDKLPPDKVG